MAEQINSACNELLAATSETVKLSVLHDTMRSESESADRERTLAQQAISAACQGVNVAEWGITEIRTASEKIQERWSGAIAQSLIMNGFVQAAGHLWATTKVRQEQAIKQLKRQLITVTFIDTVEVPYDTDTITFDPQTVLNIIPRCIAGERHLLAKPRIRGANIPSYDKRLDHSSELTIPLVNQDGLPLIALRSASI